MSDKPEFKPPPFFYPVECDFINPVASFRQNVKEGNYYYVKFQVSRELWALFEEIEAGLHLRGPLYRVRDDASDATPAAVDVKPEKPKKEKKVKTPKGPHGKFYSKLFKQWFFRNKDLKRVLECEDLPAEDDDTVKALLAEKFGVESLTFVSPEDLEAWLEANHLTGLLTISRNTPGRYPDIVPISEAQQ